MKKVRMKKVRMKSDRMNERPIPRIKKYIESKATLGS